MKLSKTALGILCAKYRAVLIRCLLASAVVFPSVASALDVRGDTTLDADTVDSTINFSSNAVLNGNNHTFGGNTIDTINVTGTGTLQDITLTANNQIIASDALTILGNVSFNAEAKIKDKLTVEDGAKVTLNNNNAPSYIENMDLKGEFNGDLNNSDLNLYDTGRFSGKIGGSNKVFLYTSNSVFDTSRLNLSAGSTIQFLYLYSKQDSTFNLPGFDLSQTDLILGKWASSDKATTRVRFDSDLTIRFLTIYEDTTGKISGTGTLNTASITGRKNSTAHFNDIKIAARGNDLPFEGKVNSKFIFDNVSISAPNTVEMRASAEFSGNSFLTAANIKTGNVTLNGTLTVDGVLKVSDGNTLGGGGYIERRSARSGGDFPDYHGERKQCHADA